MSIRVVDASGALRQLWDDGPRIYSEFDAAGNQTLTRPFSIAENARADAEAAATTAQTNEADIRAKASQALDANATFLALGASPTNAQVVAQVRMLTRECSALIRLMLRALSSTDGT